MVKICSLSVFHLCLVLGGDRSGSAVAGSTDNGGGENAAPALPYPILLGARDLQLTSSNCSTSTTADGNSVTECWEVKQGSQVQYVLHGDNQLCYLVDGLPCRSSYQCSSSSSAYYIDCRNLPLDEAQECWSVDCDGSCLPTLTETPNFASGTNGCGKIAYQCASFSASGYEFEDCTYIDVLGDGTRVAVKTEGSMGIPVSCWVDVSGNSCDCSSNCSISGEISYDCSSFSPDPCAATACGECTYPSVSPPSPVQEPSSPPPAPTTRAPARVTSTPTRPVSEPSSPNPPPSSPPFPTTPAPIQGPATPITAPGAPTPAPTLSCPEELAAWGQCVQDVNLDAKTCANCFLGYLTGLSENSTCAELTDHICSFLGYCSGVCGTTCQSSIVAYQSCYWEGCFGAKSCPSSPSSSTGAPLAPSPPVVVPAPSAPAPTVAIGTGDPSSTTRRPVVEVVPTTAPAASTTSGPAEIGWRAATSPLVAWGVAWTTVAVIGCIGA